MLLATLALLGALLADARDASGSGEMQIVSVDYRPDGLVTVGLRTPDSEARVRDVRAVVDGVPYPARLADEAALPVSVVIAIDTSASMEGQPLAAARQAAIGLVDRLAPEDRVAVLAFSDKPVLMSAFDRGTGGAIAGLEGLWLGGSTSLYSAITESLGLLALEDGRTRAVVLLSDGQDTLVGTDGDDLRRADVLDAIAASGVQMHAFAFGADADHAFLSEVASRGEGGFWSVTDAGALEDLFSHLGARLGAATQVAIDVPPLARGAHRLELHASVGGSTVEAVADFDARNEGFVWLTPRLDQRSDSDAGPIVLDVSTGLPARGLVVTARAGHVPLAVLSDPLRVLIDPWALDPGTLPVTVEVSTADAMIADATEEITVPELSPTLTFDVETSERGEVMGVLNGRAQALDGTTLVARQDGRILAQEQGTELRFPMPRDGGPLDLALELDGRVLRSLSHALPPATVVAEGRVGRTHTALAVLLVAFAVFMAWRIVRRRDRTNERWQPSGRTALVGRQVLGTTKSQHPLGALIVQSPEGEERRYELHRRPLSIGSGEQCDVSIRDDGVAAVHARLYALGGGEFRIHGIAPRGVPGRLTRNDEWVVVRHGEQVTIGRHLITLYALEESRATPYASGGAA